VPWDKEIAMQLHGARDPAAFAAHQHLTRRWARALVQGTCVAEEDLPAYVGRDGVSLAKLLDEYTFLKATAAL
jgi:hypothetical protein